MWFEQSVKECRRWVEEGLPEEMMADLTLEKQGLEKEKVAQISGHIGKHLQPVCLPSPGFILKLPECTYKHRMSKLIMTRTPSSFCRYSEVILDRQDAGRTETKNPFGEPVN